MGTITPRTASVTLYQGEDHEQFAELYRRLELEKRKADQVSSAPLRLGDDSPTAAVDEAQAAYDEFVDAAAERAVTVELRSIGRRRFRDLMTAHPPRKVRGEDGEVDHEDDAGYGVNVETFPRALLMFVDDDADEVRTITAPDLSRKALGEFVDDEITEGDFESLWTSAYYLNRMPSADPKAASSRESRSTTAI